MERYKVAVNREIPIPTHHPSKPPMHPYHTQQLQQRLTFTQLMPPP